MTTQRYNTDEQDATKRQNICLAVVKIALKQRRTKALACYYLLKQITPKSLILNYTTNSRQVARSCGISPRSLHSYIKYLRKIGLVVDRGQHILLVATRTTREAHSERKRYKITVGEGETINTIESRLFAKIIEDHSRKIAYHVRARKFMRLRMKKRRAATPKRTTFNMPSSESSGALSLSIRTVMKLLNLGAIKTRSVLRTLNSLGVIETTESSPRVLAEAPLKAVKYADLPAFCFYYKGKVYTQTGNLHQFCEINLNVEPMSYRQYIIYYKSGFSKNQHSINMPI